MAKKQVAPQANMLKTILIDDKEICTEMLKEMLENDLTLEKDGLPELRKGVALCLEQADTGTRELIEHILVSAEEHIQWLESQTFLIQQVGYENYCAQHIQSA